MPGCKESLVVALCFLVGGEDELIIIGSGSSVFTGGGHPSFEKLSTSTLSKKRGIGALLKTCFGLEGGDTCL